MIPKVYRSGPRTMITLEVRRREVLSPGFASVTLGGPGVRDLTVTGGDQAVRLFFPREEQATLRMPTIANEAWMAQLLVMPRSVRPWVRNLTIRRVRPAAGEIDIEFAVHGDSPMSSWVHRAVPGSPAGIFDTGSVYRLPPDVRHQVLIGDETALPAIASILDGRPAGLSTDVYVEVAAAADVRETGAPDGVRVHWFSRDDRDVRPGTLALDAVRGATLPSGRFYTWVAGESRLATSVRRHLTGERGVPKRDISFIGYWRLGLSSPG
ncbi:siderophore-interacting protein [Actinoplanes sp. NPDC051494]|uniref:siderophore-interacting protein n=1 Tax=Actinoplanes sp. NPDC051494 TaxID=3363907 RepID=UPI00378930B5